MSIRTMILLVVFLGGCAGLGSDPNADRAGGKKEPWLCQPDDTGAQWECARVDEVAGRPTQPPKRRTVAAPPPKESAVEVTTRPPVERQPSPPLPEPPTRDRAPSISSFDASGTAYVVQLMAAAEKSDLETYAATLGVQGLQAARVERDGDIYYVMILGVYEDRATAERAAAERPEALQQFQPWVRSLGSLQDAMRRADELVAAAEGETTP